MKQFKNIYEKGKNKLFSIKTLTWLIAITAFYLAGSVMQNILAVKSFGTEMIAITTGGTLISWAVFACMDIITEVWGKNKAIKTFIAGAILNLFFNAVCWIAIAIPGTSGFIQGSYETVLGTGWRIVIGSITAFLLGSYINTIIMHVMKVNSKDQNNTFGFITRAVLSTLAGQFVDNVLFYLIAFAPIGIPGTIENSWITILELAGFTTLIETVVEAIVSPLTARFVKYLKAKKASEEKVEVENVEETEDTAV